MILLEEVDSLLPDESKIMETIFYTHDKYSDLRRKFNSAWTNLYLEINHDSPKFQHEGYDGFDSDATVGDLDKPYEIAFTLTDATTARMAVQLFSETYRGKVYILREGFSVEDNESLAYCNNPFRLPLNFYGYGEFKRRFTARWTNLSIKLYDVAPREGGLWRGERELANDFEMSNLPNAGSAFLHDYVFISTWGKRLAEVRIAAAIRNEKFDIECERNLRNTQLKKFNEAASLEALREMSSR